MSQSYLYSEQYFRPGFPDVTGTMSRSVGENLTEWETGSPSSDGDTGPSHGFLMTSSVKYIPINYFEYFDSAHLDSDEFSRQSVRRLGHPPAPVREAWACGTLVMVETCLDLVLGMMRHAGSSPRTQTAMMQLGVVACNQIKVSSFIKFYSESLIVAPCTEETPHCETIIC